MNISIPTFTILNLLASIRNSFEPELMEILQLEIPDNSGTTASSMKKADISNKNVS